MSKEKLAKNTFFFTISLAVQKAISFLYFILIARAISVEDFGKYSFALSFATIFAMFLDFGTTQILVRESARNKEDSQKYLSNVLGFKIAASFFVYLLLVLTVNLMGYPEITKKLVYVSGLVIILDSFSIAFYSILRGLQNLLYESYGVILNQIILLALGFVVLQLNLGLVVLISVYLAGTLFNLFYSSFFLGLKYKIFPKPRFSKAIIWKILKLSLPFAIAGFFIRFYSYMDVILLSKLTNDSAVGIYSVAYKVTFALQFIGVAFSAAVYPAFCNYFVSSKDLLAKSFTKSVYYLLLISLPLSVGIITIASKVIGPVFGAGYNASVLPMQILLLALVIIFLSFPVGAMLNACNRQTTNTIILGFISVFNIVANLILIPILSYVGAAISALLSYVLLFSIGLFFVGKIIDYDKKYLVLSTLKIIFSCLIMGLVVLTLKNSLHFIFVIPLGALSYIIILYLIKGFSKNDIFQLKDLLLKKS
ncbi:MAG: flippase [Candidatus Buchananbacteria bacterium]|nr:flippase [Candidatus Buchananbacteria bacterium]